jgi:hypothetical protein
MTFIHVKSFIYKDIHPCKRTKIILKFKFQTQSSKLKLCTHAQAILLRLEMDTIQGYAKNSQHG